MCTPLRWSAPPPQLLHSVRAPNSAACAQLCHGDDVDRSARNRASTLTGNPCPNPRRGPARHRPKLGRRTAQHDICFSTIARAPHAHRPQQASPRAAVICARRAIKSQAGADSMRDGCRTSPPPHSRVLEEEDPPWRAPKGGRAGPCAPPFRRLALACAPVGTERAPGGGADPPTSHEDVAARMESEVARVRFGWGGAQLAAGGVVALAFDGVMREA